MKREIKREREGDRRKAREKKKISNKDKEKVMLTSRR